MRSGAKEKHKEGQEKLMAQRFHFMHSDVCTQDKKHITDKD
jgi:hypothetical protein